jgi:adenosylmethionine-8-amino-7-oxononanoate aminotransferase
VKLAELLVEATPKPLQKVFLCDSGSISVEVAIKMALQYWHGLGQPKRRRLLTLRGGYHGDTFGAMSVCDPVNGMHSLFQGTLSQQLFAPRPAPRWGQTVGDEDIAEFAALLRAHASEVAAVVLEPVVQGAGGMHMYAPEYLARVRALCDETDTLLICDEIATGFGRTGALFACDHAGIVPDIMCLGKALTGGYCTLGATLATEQVAVGVSTPPPGSGGTALPFMHGPTFMANPLACAIAGASVELLLASDWRGRVAAIEEQLRAELAPAASLPGVADVRVLGAIGVVEMEEAVDVPEVTRRLVEKGVWLRPFGKLIYTMPPFVISPAELRQVTSGIVRAVTETERT